MNTTEYSWMNALGWSLVHTLWQGLVLFLLVKIILHLFSPRDSRSRYAINVSAFFLMILSFVSTFVFLLPQGNGDKTLSRMIPVRGAMEAMGQEQDFLTGVLNFLSHHVHQLIALWAVGVVIFLLRILGGWYFLSRLRRRALLLEGEWMDKVKDWCRKLGIQKSVLLAESFSISTPVAMGYLKPMIVVPVGMFSGLTPEEIETILVHELMHIRRHDFLINVLQLVGESLLFFNPFIWLLSTSIRKEREHCCDDGVLTHHQNALAYAYALTRLQESYGSGFGMAMPAVRGKYHLLERVRRMMEKSVKPFSLKEKMIPVILLMMALGMLSFITLKPEEKIKVEGPEISLLQDTVFHAPVKREKKAVTSKKEKKKERKQNRVEETRNPSRPVHSFGIVSIAGDTLPPLPPLPQMNWDEGEWKDFRSEFERIFQNQFGEFFKENQEKFSAMMEDLEKEMEFNGQGELKKHMELAMRVQEEAMRRQEEMMRLQEQVFRMQERGEKLSQKDQELIEKKFQLAQERQEEMMALQEQRIAEVMERARRIQAEKMQVLELVQETNLKKVEEEMKRVEEKMKIMEEKIRAFNQEMRVQLEKDGYLEKGESLHSMQWNQGEMEVNGKKIKKQDQKKYEGIRQKYFKAPKPE